MCKIHILHKSPSISHFYKSISAIPEVFWKAVGVSPTSPIAFSSCLPNPTLPVVKAHAAVGPLSLLLS